MNTSLNNGYIVQNIEKFDPKYRCLVCLNLLRNPVQLDCGHRICQTCFQPENNYVQCLECKSETIISEIRLDKGFHRDMQLLEVLCKSCEWSGKLKNYQEHLEQSHRQYKCPYCSEIFDSLSLIEGHTEKSCTKRPLNCILQEYGCKEQFFRGDIGRHYLTEEHQTSIMLCLDQFISELKKQYLTSAITDSNMTMETSDLPYKVTTAATTTNNIETLDDDLKHLHETITILSSGTHTYSEELIRLNSESLQQSQALETADKLLPTIKTSIEESNDVLNAMNTNLMILEQELSSLKQKYEDHQVTSYDGTLVWKIPRFREKMTDAKSERQVSIYSPPFCSSPTGYKMRARLYLYGDGNARRTHMSLFFVLMRGPNDSLLPFPFSYKVTFCLFDQSGHQCHIIDSFRPDIKSNSFQRPRSDMNIASGIPKFAALSIFEKPDNPYVKDDTMFIKVMVDFENMPKSMLPYVLGLNPALPMHAQQQLIRREIDRRTQQSQSTAPVTTVSNDSTNMQDNHSSNKK